jgi:holo-[acyl-carrier protein] synthase
MSVKIGIDLVAVSEIEESVALHSTRYLERVYTPDELTDCRGADGTPDPARLAARFAAKEATLKILARGDDAVSWQAIVIRRNHSGTASLELTGAAAALARSKGIEEMDVSMTHNGPFAAAVVMARMAADR